MLDETIGRNERRATAVVMTVLIVEALWAFLHKYLPLDAGLWALQTDLVREHLSGHTGDGWKLIPFPAANTGVPFISGILSFLFSSEITVRLLLVIVGLLLRGSGLVVLFRVLRVRDETVYYLIPVIAGSCLWFSGSMPYLIGETFAVWTLAYFFSQDRPRGSAFGILSAGLAITALCHALAFIFALVVVVAVMFEQRRSVHLSQGWLSSGRTILSLLIPGIVVLALTFFTGQPVFRITTSAFMPEDPFRFLVFLVTPVPDVLEATFKGGDYVHGVFSVALWLLVLACFARAFLLAIEEPTWQSRAMKTAGFLLFIGALLGPVVRTLGIDSSAWIGVATLAILGGSYSRGPAVRRTPIDRLLLATSLVLMIATGLVNGFSINRGSEAASDVIKSARRLVYEEKEASHTADNQDSLHFRMVLDSAFAQMNAPSWVGTVSYTMTSPVYLFTSNDALRTPSAFQPLGGSVRSMLRNERGISPARRLDLSSIERYLLPADRLIAVLPRGTSTSPTFGNYELTIVDTIGTSVARGEASFQLLVGKLSAHRSTGLASLAHPIQ